MGNILNLNCETNILPHWVSKQIQSGRTINHQSKLWSVMVLRALSEHIRRAVIKEKGISCGQFQLWSILICSVMSGNICRKQIYRKGVTNDRFQLLGILICGVISDYIIGMKNDPIKDLPEDMQRIIFSKLTLKEAVRTSAVSRGWRYLWQVSPKLSFDGITMCGKNTSCKTGYSKRFIKNVDAVLIQCRGMVVEELAIKFYFHTMLISHLNNWVTFAVSSQTKFLTFDLVPEDVTDRWGRYMFPFELLDMGSISRLQKIQLSYVSLLPPTQFSGFPHLQRLDLNWVVVNGKDLSEMLSNCRKLEWLSLVRCDIFGELKVKSTLTCLEYLNVAYCIITNIALQAVKLATLEYKGAPVPIDLSKSSGLETADIHFYRGTVEHAMNLLANVVTNVKHLNFNIPCRPPQIPNWMDYKYKFSLLKHLKSMLLFVEDVDSTSLAKFLSTADYIEELEVHFSIVGVVHVVQEPIARLLDCPFNYMKSLCFTGFRACHGQVQLLMHMVQNAPALEVLTIDLSNKYKPPEYEEREAEFVDLVHGTARRYLEGKISAKCTLRLL